MLNVHDIAPDDVGLNSYGEDFYNLTAKSIDGEIINFSQYKGKKILVVNVMGRVFMDALDDPFASVKKILNNNLLGKDVNISIIDVHAEATSEKMAMGHEFDGKVSLVVGTHTHIPTADARILNNGTAYISDLGMCGDYDSVIGLEKTKTLERFKKKTPVGHISPASGEATLSAVFVEIDDSNGLAKSIQSIIIGGQLQSNWP